VLRWQGQGKKRQIEWGNGKGLRNQRREESSDEANNARMKRKEWASDLTKVHIETAGVGGMRCFGGFISRTWVKRGGSLARYGHWGGTEGVVMETQMWPEKKKSGCTRGRDRYCMQGKQDVDKGGSK